MRLRRFVFAVLFVLFASSAFAQGEACAACVSAPHEIQVTAKKYEFNPNLVTVKKGERVKLIITATDHGFKLEDFKVDQLLKKGVPTTVEFTADKVGEFNFHCSHFCGIGHPKMKGKMVVQDN